MYVLVFNPGGNSLKVELVGCAEEQRFAFEGSYLLSVSVEGIGKNATLSRLSGKKTVSSDAIQAKDYAEAVEAVLSYYQRSGEDDLPKLSVLDAIAIRVVHGGPDLDKPTLLDSNVEEKLIALEKLAPLHNARSVEVLGALRQRLPEIPMYGVFDTAFHRTMPDYVATYAIPIDLAERNHIRRYGFHGISHRYLWERYAFLAGKSPEECNVVTMHLESGCSVTAIHQGKSVDNTMGMTPLEGLMMGTRSGDIDPAIIPLLMQSQKMSVDEVLEILNKKSGLEGVSGLSLDTRVLMQHYDSNQRVRLAMDMFAYRLRKAVGSYMAALGTVDAVIFGGGIGENGDFVRRFVCDGLRGFGIDMDDHANHALIDIEGRLTVEGSRAEAWVIPTEEGLQIAHECSQQMTAGNWQPYSM